MPKTPEKSPAAPAASESSVEPIADFKDLAKVEPAVLQSGPGRGEFYLISAEPRPKAHPVDPLEAPFELPGAGRWMALSMVNWYWMEPFFGRDLWEIPRETQFLLCEVERIEASAEKLYRVLIPLITEKSRATIRGTTRGEATLRLRWSSGMPRETETEDACLLFAAEGPDPYALIRDGMTAIAARLKTFRLREEKRRPEVLDHLGWCTWDAFYQEVTHDKVLDGLEQLHKAGVKPGFIILDDGWLTIDGEYLAGFEADPEKFPEGLAGLGKALKERFGVHLFGIWHAFPGYWAGVSIEKFGADYGIVETSGAIRPWDHRDTALNFIDPDDISRFYQDFHGRLREWGVDLIKVDGQSSLELFSKGWETRVRAMGRYQEALQASAARNFGDNLIHCMCNQSDVLMQMVSSSVWRNSDDFFPKRGLQQQLKHIHMNGLNALLTHAVTWPDWDMFQSGFKQAEFHAVGRAISGGPVYLSDAPGGHQPEIIKRLCFQDGSVPRWEQPALPAEDCLLTDCCREQKLFKVYNFAGDKGRAQLACFNCRFRLHENDPAPVQTEAVAPAAVHGLEGERFAVWRFYREELQVLTREETIELSLDEATAEMLFISAIDKHGIAPLGHLRKLAGLTEAGEGRRIDADLLLWKVRKPGNLGFYMEKAPTEVRSGEGTVSFHFNPASRLLTLDCHGVPGPVELEIYFS